MSNTLVKQLEEVIDRKIGVFVEHIDDKFDGMIDAFDATFEIMDTLAKDSDLQEVKQDVKLLHAALKATNIDQHGLKRRVAKLETTANNA